jgi:nucleotide-binding universal stress UspA family protein
MVTRIVVGTDGSPTAGDAVRQAIDLAKATGASLVIVQAYTEREPHDPATAYEPTLQEDDETAQLPDDVPRPVGKRAEALATLEGAVAAATEAGVEDVASEAREGDPAEAIIAVAEESGADMILVGNKGMTGAKRFLLGSVPDKITHHAPCNVFVARTT